MTKLATPISNLFKENEVAREIISCSDCLEIRDFSINFEGGKQEVFHCELQPIHELTTEEFSYLKKIKDLKSELKLITFHCASNYNKPINNESGMSRGGGTRYSEKEMRENAKKNFSKIKEIFGDNIRIGVENNNYYPTEAYKYVTESGFIANIVYDNNLEFLFDIAHAKITCHNKKIKFADYKKGLPLNKIIQLHISHYGIGKYNLAYDVHEIPGPEEIDEVKNLIKNFDIKYLTVECYKDKNNLINSLREFKKII